MLACTSRRAGARSASRPALERAEPFVDLAAIVALTYTSGGPFSETGMAFFVLPLLAAARLRPRRDGELGRGVRRRVRRCSRVLHPTRRRGRGDARA